MTDPTPPVPGGDGKDFVLQRELSEVHLLLDHISSSPTSHIPTEIRPATGLDEHWLRKVCDIRWPPAGSSECQSEQAEFLIRVKDYLNTLAKPASGLTIAFTLLVNQEEAAMDSSPPSRGGASPSRRRLAGDAYPDLEPRSRTFRVAMQRIRGFLLAWLIVTCMLSWYVAFGNAALAQRSAALVQVQEARANLITAGAQTAETNASPEHGVVELKPCPRPDKSMPVAGCTDVDLAEGSLDDANKQISKWLFRFSSPGSNARSAFAATLVAILGTAVLPVLYGFLGAGAAILRVLSYKIKHNELEPRDLNLSLQQLALGAVTGACIGLFVAAPGEAGKGAAALGPVTLSGSALSFIAGFGVDAVFATLEGVIGRIFNVSSTGAEAASLHSDGWTAGRP